MSDSLGPYELQPTRLLCPWDFPGKRTGVGCHCLLQITLKYSINVSFNWLYDFWCFLVYSSHLCSFFDSICIKAWVLNFLWCCNTLFKLKKIIHNIFSVFWIVFWTISALENLAHSLYVLGYCHFKNKILFIFFLKVVDFILFIFLKYIVQWVFF